MLVVVCFQGRLLKRILLDPEIKQTNQEPEAHWDVDWPQQEAEDSNGR